MKSSNSQPSPRQSSFRSSGHTHILVILAALLFAVNIRAHYHCVRPVQGIEIAQTYLAGARDAVLLEKRPLVILDCVASHVDLVRLSAFRLLHVKAFLPRVFLHREGDPHLIATARFTLLYQSQQDWTRVEIRHPVTGEGAIVILHRHQTLVLPPRWRYTCLDGATTMLELHDCVSLLLRLFCITRVSPTASRQA